MRFFGKFPFVRLKQFRDNPTYILFWLRRLFSYKRKSYEFLSKYSEYEPLSPEDTLRHIIEHNCSLIRFGDGEFGILAGAGIYPPDSDWSQRYSPALCAELERIMKLNEPKILLAFPAQTIVCADAVTAQSHNLIASMHTELRMFLWRFIKSGCTYGDWGVFMPQHNNNIEWNRLERYLEDKTVVIVTGGIKQLQNEVALGAETLFIEAGKHDAFERLVEIISSVDKTIGENHLNPQKTLFMVSLGCNAGFVVEYLARLGYVAWDTGHFFRYAHKELSELSRR